MPSRFIMLDPDEINIASRAFSMAAQILKLQRYSLSKQQLEKLIADYILSQMSTGQRDPEKLCEGCVAHLRPRTRSTTRKDLSAKTG